jgi:hypothetical protein
MCISLRKRKTYVAIVAHENLVGFTVGHLDECK